VLGLQKNPQVGCTSLAEAIALPDGIQPFRQPTIQVKCNEFVYNHCDRPSFSPKKNFLLFFHHLSMLVARPWSHNNFGGKLFPISRPLWPATAFGYFRFRLVYLCFLPPYIPIAIHSAIWHSGSSSISHRNCMLCTFCCHGGFIFQFQHSQVFFCSFGSISVCPVKLALKRWSLSN